MDVVTSPVDVEPQLANCTGFWLGYGAELRQDGPLALFRSGVQHPLFNGVRRTQVSLEDAWERARQATAGTPWQWWVGEDSAPGVADDLRRRGAVLAASLPVMALEVGRVRLSAPPAGLIVGEVGPADIDEWVHVWVPASDIDARFAPAVTRAERARTRPPDGDYVRLAGWWDGRIVGSAVLFIDHGVAGLYAVSTDPAHRRRGIGRAMSQAAVLAAQERGCRVVALEATPQGLPVYLKMGFETVAEYQIFAPPDRR